MCLEPAVRYLGNRMHGKLIVGFMFRGGDAYLYLLTSLLYKFFRIETGKPLFKPRGPARDRIVRNTEISGPVPQAWCSYWPQSTGTQGI